MSETATTTDITINRLLKLKNNLDPDSDEYADVSQTIYYLELEKSGKAHWKE